MDILPKHPPFLFDGVYTTPLILSEGDYTVSLLRIYGFYASIQSRRLGIIVQKTNKNSFVKVS